MPSLLTISVILSSLVGALPSGVETLAARLAARPAFECDFRQERSLPGMRVPLRSSGTFRFDPGKEAVWVQTTPVAQTILLRREGMELLRPDGSSQKLSSSAPVAGEIASALFALGQGDLAVLSKTFDVKWVKQGETDWSLKLLPRGVASKAFKDIVLSGGADLRSILLTDAAGLPTRIEFGPPRPLASAK
jgi:hypothetical protein